MLANGQGAGHNRQTDFHFFDALPRSVKELLWYALPNLNSADVVATQKRWTLTEAELHEEWHERVVEYQLTETTRTYGPLHPQARK